MQLNWYIIFITALIPLIIGFVWYNPKVFGNAWMKSINVTEEDLKGSNMALIFGLCYFFGLLLSVMLMPLVIHQMHMSSVFADDITLKDPNSASSLYLKNFMDTYGTKFRTFKHGVFHGVLDTLFFALPILGTVALFERRGFKYIAIHVGFWAVTIGLMGGIICQFV